MVADADAAFCVRVLAKGGRTVLTATLGSIPPEAWVHYPPGEVFDPESGAQWYYHCHDPAPEGGEHGHFHCFVRPSGPGGPVHHLVAVGVDPLGRPLRLFTVNRWVVGDDWLDAPGSIAMLPRFDVQMPQPDYLVNRWLTALLAAHEAVIVDLLHARDATLAAHSAAQGTDPRDDLAMEVTSEYFLT